MKYLVAAIKSTASKPSYLFLFVMFSLLVLPVSIIGQMGIVQGVFAIAIMIFTGAISLYLVTGVYSAAWESLKGNKIKILAGSNQYFTRVLVITIAIGLTTAIVVISSSLVYKMAFFRYVPATIYGKRFDVNLVRSIPAFLIASVFIYTLPSIFVANLPSNEAVAKSWRFFLYNFNKSIVVIAILLLSTIVKISYSQWAVSFDNSSIQYWQIIVLSSIFTCGFNFLAFLTAAQIFDEYFREESAI